MMLLDPRRGASGWAWGALGIAAVAAASVFFAFDAVPFMDLPAHAGLFALRGRFAMSPFEQELYVLAPHLGGYSMFRFLGGALTPLCGPLTAARALEALGVVALPLAILDARRRLYGRTSPAFGFLGIALGFGLMTILGFASFLIGMALLVECTAISLEILAKVQGGERTGSLEATLAASAVLLLLLHGFAFAIFVSIVVVGVLVRGGRRSRFWRARALAPAGLLAACAVWLEQSSPAAPLSAPFSQPRVGPLFQPVTSKLSLLLTPTLLTRTGLDIAVGLVVWGTAIAGVVSTLRWLKRPRGQDEPRSMLEASAHARALLACSLFVSCTFLALPHEMGWFGFIDGRLVPIILLLTILGVPDLAMGPRLALAFERVFPAAACLIVGLALVASQIFQREATGYREVFARVPSLSRVLNLPVDPNSDIFAGHPFVHYDKLMLADRPILVSDLWFHQGSAVFPRPGNPVLRLPTGYLSSDIRGVDWSLFVLQDWDYVLMRTKPDGAQPSTPAALQLVVHLGGWWLYKTDGPSQRRRS
jgi:hypothetical protein